MRHPFVPARLGMALALVATAFLGGPTASAQDAPLDQMALAWARGRFASPLICEGPNGLEKTLRRIVVSAGPRHRRPPENRLQLVGIEVEGAERCFATLGGDQPDLEGVLVFQYPSYGRPDLASHEFQSTLRRDGGFEYRIRTGKLRISDPDAGDEASGAREVDFARGKLRVNAVPPGSDADRVLADFPGARKLTLQLEAPDETRLELHMIQYDQR